MKRKTTVYVAVAIISLVLYLAGIFSGITIQKSVSDSMESKLALIKNDIESQQQELLLLNLQGKESCAVLRSLSSITAMKLESVSDEIRKLEDRRNDEQFSKMKETYSTLSIQAWIVMTAVNKNCDPKTVPILYYYSFPCEQCHEQESVLEYFKSIDKQRILTYAVDKDVNTSLVQILVKSHNIGTAPSIVYGDIIYNGFVDKGNLSAVVCREINLTCANQTETL